MTTSDPWIRPVNEIDRRVLRCAGCTKIMGMAEPSRRLYGKTPLAFCERECLDRFNAREEAK